jgi:hypothetical protein
MGFVPNFSMICVYRLADQLDDVLALDEGHLEVELRELGLAIRAQILVAESSARSGNTSRSPRP